MLSKWGAVNAIYFFGEIDQIVFKMLLLKAQVEIFAKSGTYHRTT